MNNPTITCEMHWRGLDLIVQHDQRQSPTGSDRFYIKAGRPFYPGGPDYLVRWLQSLERAYTENEFIELAEMWLDDELDNCSRCQDADVKRNQLSLL